MKFTNALLVLVTLVAMTGAKCPDKEALQNDEPRASEFQQHRSQRSENPMLTSYGRSETIDQQSGKPAVYRRAPEPPTAVPQNEEQAIKTTQKPTTVSPASRSFSWGTWATLAAIALKAKDKIGLAVQLSNRVSPLILVVMTVAGLAWESAIIMFEGSAIMGVLGLFIGDGAGEWFTTIPSELFGRLVKGR